MQSYWSALQFAPTNLPVFYRGMPQASHGIKCYCWSIRHNAVIIQIFLQHNTVVYEKSMQILPGTCSRMCKVDKSRIILRPSKGFERQATLRQNVATICNQSTDSRQKLTRKKRQFAKTTIHFSFRQSDNCTFFLRRLHGCHDLTRPA